ncbi:alpha-L-fucosidase [Melioribacter sp. OK-6-Me]|uniref:alpha-L-fucosidase n=1 Tax=unclassified Melioribacter TaxID=2627329 RepID=UPI003ED89A2D
MKRILVIVLLALISINVMAQKGYKPTEENLENREWFRNAKFGLFVHWGIYSVLGDGEWVMEQQRIDKHTYEKVASFFNPVEFDPKEWVQMIKDAGMKYITITTRHHDGFSMFHTKESDWNIIDKTPYKKDIIKMITDECHKEGIKIFFYYSLVDWYHEDYYPRGATGHYSGRGDKGDWNKYIEFMKAQLTELLTNYGEIAGIWFDGLWDKEDADWKIDEIYELIHRLQPQCMIGNNHHHAPNEGEDFQMFEKDLPGQNKSGFSKDTEISKLPLETCETINNSWGFNLRDKNYKSVKTIVDYLVKAAGNDANLLLNVGPMPNGRIQKEFVDTLRSVGKWLQKYGETIYDTRKGPIEPHSWGVSTQKGNRIFIHLLAPEDEVIFLPYSGRDIKHIKLFDSNRSLDYIQNKLGVLIKIAKDDFQPYDTILVIETND